MPLTIFFSSPGTYTIEDDGIRGNNTSVVKDSSGTVLFPFVHPGDTIDFIAEVPGITFVFNTVDSFGTANVNVGSLTDPNLCPDVISVRQMRTDAFMTLASRGTIIEGGIDAAADIVTAGLVLSALNGVGTTSNALETQVTFIEAETTTGGINIANFGNVQAGGLTPEVNGLSVATSGNLNFSNNGFILLADTTGGSSVHGGDISGNVILTALGADADIFSNIDWKVISNAGGGITLNAGRDVIFGTSGTNFDNDLLATGPITINAGRDFQLDGTSDIRTGAFGGVVGGAITITTGRNITLTAGTGGLQTIQAFAGDIVLTTGLGGGFIEFAAFPGAIQTTNDIFLNADLVEIASGGLNTTGIGSVTIKPVTPGRPIDLGNPLDPPGTLALSDNEFDLLFTLNVNIGSADTGNVTFSAPLSPFIVDNLTVHSGNDILFNSSLSLPRALILRAGDDLYFAPTASFSSSNAGFTAFVDNAQADDSLGGLGTLAGTLTVATNIRLNGNLDADTLNGSSGDDMIMGNAAADTLRGFGGADLLDGGVGRDTMEGGLGDDTFIVDNSLDLVIEAAGEGFDTVQSSITHTLAAEVERLVLTGTANLNGNGNGLDNVLLGNGGANTLDGKAGVDNLRGGGGNDTYVVQDVGDSIVELAAAGTDLVRSSVSFSLGSNLENLTLTGAGAINGNGNPSVNVLTGNNAANILNGGAAADTMIGLAGSDTYIVDNAGDVVTEAATGGAADTVQSSISYVLGANVEKLTLTGSAANGTGNGLANTIVGNGAANLLDGAGGADTMIGGGGNDTYEVNIGGDVVTEAAAAGTDLVRSSVSYSLSANVENLTLTGIAAINGTGNNLVNTLIGNSAANTLNGGTGADTLVGGGGNDTYIVDNNAEIITEAAGAGVDQVNSSVNFTLPANVENIVVTGAAAAGATGNALANVITGNANINALKGLGGADTIAGGAGNDDIYGGSGNDDLTGGAGADKFRFDTALNAATNVDDILDFSVADDTVFLNRAIFTGISADGPLSAAAFLAGTAATDADDRIIHDSVTGNIFYDSDGIGGAAQILFATVDAGTVLTRLDFVAYTG